MAEVLSLPVRYLAELPVPPTLCLRLVRFARPVHVTVSGRRYKALSAEGAVVFAPAELLALTAALESGRATREDVLGWCRRKLEVPGWKLSAETALGQGVTVPAPEGAGWTIGRLLEELAGRVVAIDLEHADQTTETVWTEVA